MKQSISLFFLLISFTGLKSQTTVLAPEVDLVFDFNKFYQNT
jgi:hypothetical protein